MHGKGLERKVGQWHVERMKTMTAMTLLEL